MNAADAARIQSSQVNLAEPTLLPIVSDSLSGQRRPGYDFERVRR